MAAGTPANMQGDLFSRGFPKYNESYYFFSIKTDHEKVFTQNLAKLIQKGEISTLEKVHEDWDKVDASKRLNKDTVLDMSHALIAFTMAGLETIQKDLPKDKLGLLQIAKSDPAFASGTAQDKALNDPDDIPWDPMFRPSPNPIHSVLEVSESSAGTVKAKLEFIKGVLGYAEVIVDVNTIEAKNSKEAQKIISHGLSLTKPSTSFGFKDGVSQPLLKNIDKDEMIAADPSMATSQSVITVTADRARNGLSGAKAPCPVWMHDGSFLVFRKLEQDVGKFQEYMSSTYERAGCKSAEQFGARLMGRWQSGKAYVLSPEHHPKGGHGSNEFTFEDPKGCPLAAHIRKVRVRRTTETSPFIHIIRNGIPYGTDYVAHDTSTNRGLLFACYQSSIENGFRHIQTVWANFNGFPTDDSGCDPFIGQPPKGKKMQTAVLISKGSSEPTDLWDILKFVTIRGGEYFFAPSISALKSVLGTP